VSTKADQKDSSTGLFGGVVEGGAVLGLGEDRLGDEVEDKARDSDDNEEDNDDSDKEKVDNEVGAGGLSNDEDENND